MKREIKFRVEGFSHGKEIRFELENIPAGEKINMEKLQEYIDFRASKNKKFATKRHENDIVNINSGIINGYTTGEKIVGYFTNSDTNSKDYRIFNEIPRPSHIDYVAKIKYGDDFDLSGSSLFSGRLTVGFVAMGGIAKQILERKKIYISSHIKRLFNVEDKSFDEGNLTLGDFSEIDKNFPVIDEVKREKMEELLHEISVQNDSVGGVVEVAVLGEIKGFGGPYAERLESKISKNIFSIPGIRALEFGNGIDASSKKGSENNDLFVERNGEISTSTNNSGGINGGIANGMPIIIRAFVKPTASIKKPQRTLNIKTHEFEDLVIEGRHDPAFILRISTVIESMLALSIIRELDFEEKSNREKIDEIDNQIRNLMRERFEITDEIGRLKALNRLEILDREREKTIIERLSDDGNDTWIPNIYNTIFLISRNRQNLIKKRYSASYGLIGEKLKHSYSPEIHKELGGYFYSLFELKENELEKFLSYNYKGLNVTIPYKEKVIKYLDGLSDQAKEIGAVNTIQFVKGKKYGFNTDYYGFLNILKRKKIEIEGKKVLILGTGASSKTVEFVIKKLKAQSIDFVSRSGDLNYLNVYDKVDAQVIVNTTPVGMYPNNGVSLLDLDRFPYLESVVDLVYNPHYSKLILDAMKKGIKYSTGLPMLVYQAKKSIEIFNGKKIQFELAEKLIDKLIRSKINIVLVGMPGSGKTTIGRRLSYRLGKKHVDLDNHFKKTYNILPSEALKLYGEKRFRDMEEKVAEAVGKMTNLVISTGGGVVTRKNNYYSLKQNSIIFNIERKVENLSTRNRPLSQGGIEHLFKLKESREELYKFFADYEVINDDVFEYSVKEISEIYKNIRFNEL